MSGCHGSLRNNYIFGRIIFLEDAVFVNEFNDSYVWVYGLLRISKLN